MDKMFIEALNVDTEFFGLADFELFLFVFGEKVSDSFVVDFHHGDHDFEGLVFVVGAFDFLEYLVAHYRDDTPVGSVADHRVALA
jgi:hypothetical protein